MNTIRREFPRSAVACFAAVAMMFAGITGSTARDVDVGVKFRVLIPAPHTDKGTASPEEGEFDLRLVSVFLPKGQQISTGLSFHLAAISATSGEGDASHMGHYAALPDYSKMNEMAGAEFDLKRVPALIPKQAKTLVGEQFRVAELSTAVTDGKLTLRGVPVDTRTLQAMFTEQPSAWRSDEELGAWYKSTEAPRPQESLLETLLAPRTF